MEYELVESGDAWLLTGDAESLAHRATMSSLAMRPNAERRVPIPSFAEPYSGAAVGALSYRIDSLLTACARVLVCLRC